jgi:hypothetical protein
MRIALILIIGMHGIIHLFGFLKAFGIAEFNAISQSISKSQGLIWLATFILFSIIFISIIYKLNYWWLIGFIAVISSQLLIVIHWSDAKFGTIANIILLVASILAYANFNFKNKISEERKSILKSSISANETILTRESISKLPAVVQKWLINNGTIGKSPISNVHIVQELKLKMQPDQTEWNEGKAEQYFTIQPPAFNWDISTQMNSILRITGRDKFENGNGEMSIKLFSLIPVVDAKDNDKINEATLQRYLAEIVWFPSAALSSYIGWESIDENTAKATIAINGVRATGEFHYDIYGDFKKFVSMRYRDVKSTKPTEWSVHAIQTEERNGIKIPVECEASWKLESGNWTWLKLKIKTIKYNIKAI